MVHPAPGTQQQKARYGNYQVAHEHRYPDSLRSHSEPYGQYEGERYTDAPESDGVHDQDRFRVATSLKRPEDHGEKRE